MDEKQPSGHSDFREYTFRDELVDDILDLLRWARVPFDDDLVSVLRASSIKQLNYAFKAACFLVGAYMGVIPPDSGTGLRSDNAGRVQNPATGGVVSCSTAHRRDDQSDDECAYQQAPGFKWGPSGEPIWRRFDA